MFQQQCLKTLIIVITTKHSDKKVKTGDEAPIIIWAIVIVICIAGLVVVWKGKKKN